MAAVSTRRGNFYSGQDQSDTSLHIILHRDTVPHGRDASPRGTAALKYVPGAATKVSGAATKVPEEVDWVSGVASSLRREVEELRRRNLALEVQISTVEEPSCSPIGASFGGLSGLSTAVASKGGQDYSSHAMSWSRLSPPEEDRFATERRLLRDRVSKLEGEHRVLEMAKMRRMAASDRPKSAAEAYPRTTVNVVHEVDDLSRQVRDAEAACQNVERKAIEKESQLRRAHCELEQYQHLDSAEGRRLLPEAQQLRDQLRDILVEHDSVEAKLREAEELASRAGRQGAALQSDCGILGGTREALFLEEVSLRERLGAVGRARLQTTSTLMELREENDEILQRKQAEVQELMRFAEETESEVAATNARLSLCDSARETASEESVANRSRLADLHPAHSELRDSLGSTRGARQQKLQTESKEADTGSIAKDQTRVSLTRATSSLQELREAYALRLQRLKEVAATLSVEHARTSSSCERLRVLISEMYSHAESLARQLDGERKCGDDLWKEVSAVMEATNLVKAQVARKSRGSRVTRENDDPASKASAAMGVGRKRNLTVKT